MQKYLVNFDCEFEDGNPVNALKKGDVILLSDSDAMLAERKAHGCLTPYFGEETRAINEAPNDRMQRADKVRENPNVGEITREGGFKATKHDKAQKK